MEQAAIACSVPIVALMYCGRIGERNFLMHNIADARAVIQDDGALISDRINAVMTVGAEEVRSGRSISTCVSLPSERGDTMADPCLLDRLSRSTFQTPQWRIVWAALGTTVLIVALGVMVMMPSSTAAPILEWLQSWLP